MSLATTVTRTVTTATATTPKDDNANGSDADTAEIVMLTQDIFREAERVRREEPALAPLLQLTVLASNAPGQYSLDEAIAHTICYRLLSKPCGGNNSNSNSSNSNNNSNGPPVFCPHTLHSILLDCLHNTSILEYGSTMREAVLADWQAVVRRDPAMDTHLQVLLFSKGFAALVCHRAAFRLWQRQQRYTALFLQSQCSAVFGLDIHPASVIGPAVMMDHGTGVVIGETAVIGYGCTLLHGVTLGGTGKDHGDRHPKIGNNVLIGAGTSILGNIRVGSNSKIGAGSVVLREIPEYATAVGAPAKIVGRVPDSERPGSDMDETLVHMNPLHKSKTVLALLEKQHQQQQQQQQVTKDERTTTTTIETSSDYSSDGEQMTTPVPLSVTTTTGTGTTSTRSSSSSSLEEVGADGMADNLCPWRHFKTLGQQAPSGTITICHLCQLLRPLGATMAEIGNCFFALDTHMVGYVKLPHFVTHAPKALPKYCPSVFGTDHNSADERVSRLVEQAILAVENKSSNHKSKTVVPTTTTAADQPNSAPQRCRDRGMDP